MSNFENYGDAAIAMQRSDDFNKAAQVLSDYIAGLPISTEQNDKLVGLMVEQVNISEHDAYLQGFDLGLKIARAAAEGEL